MLPETTVVAQGYLPSGEQWVLHAGGIAEDFSTSLETIRPDGHRDQGGMAGPALYPDTPLNVYIGGADRGLRRVLVRADVRVTRIEIRLGDGDLVSLPPAATWPDPPLALFAALLPPTAHLASITALDAAGRELEKNDLTRHEAAWRRFTGGTQ
jgi:hypothetical protein